MRATLRFLRSTGLYIAIVIGGVTLFLILAPVVGYLPYSDRPGPGWFASFPALTWSQFFSNAWGMIGYGVFLGILFIVPSALGVLIIRGIEHVAPRPLIVRSLGAVIAAVIAGYWMLGAGWYIAAGTPLLVIAVVSGALAGAWVVPVRRRHDAQGV